MNPLPLSFIQGLDIQLASVFIIFVLPGQRDKKMRRKGLINVFKQTKEAFREKSFIFLFLAEIITVFGDVLFYTAITWFIYTQSNSTTAISLLNLSDLLPTLLFVFFFGILIDRSSSRMVFRIIYITQSVVALILIAAFFSGRINLFVILLCVFVNAMVASGKSPLVNKVLVKIGKESLSDRNTILSVGKKICTIVGSLLAGLLAENLFLIIFIDFLTFIGAFAFISRIKLDEEPQRTTQSRSIKEEFRETFLYLNKKRTVLRFILVFVFIIIAGTSITLSMPIVSKEILQMDKEGYGLLKSALSTGGLFVIFLMPLIGKCERKIHWLICVSGLTMILYALGTNLYFNLLILTLTGILSNMADILFTTILQKIIDEKIIGKLFSVIVAVIILSNMVGNIIYGFLFDHFSVRGVLIASGGTFILFAFFLRRIVQSTFSSPLSRKTRYRDSHLFPKAASVRKRRQYERNRDR